MKNNEITIIGAGNGGRAFAVYLSDIGFKVNLGFQTYENITTILKMKKIYSKGIIRGNFPLNIVSANYRNLIRNSKYILIVVPANVHLQIIDRILPSLQDGQMILLNPGRTFGAVEIYNRIREKRPNLQILIAETQTLLFTCRKIKDFGVDIIKIKNQIDCCFYPEKFHPKYEQELKNIFPQLNFVNNICITSLNNIGALLHPTISILNTGSILRKKSFLFYNEVSLKISKVIRKMDKERSLILKKLGFRPKTFLQWVNDSYGVKSQNYYEAFRQIESYKTIKAPNSLNVRYLTEDVPTGLVPLSSLGKYLKIKTPIIDSFITLASTLLGVDFRKEGRTIDQVNFPIEKYSKTRKIAMKKILSSISSLKDSILVEKSKNPYSTQESKYLTIED